jgi:hypothetical protein
VTDAQLLNANGGAIVVKDCPAQGSCSFRVDVTSDGGATWRHGRDLVVAGAADGGSPSQEDPITGLTMISSTNMYAYGASVWHTSDAGATWTQPGRNRRSRRDRTRRQGLARPGVPNSIPPAMSSMNSRALARSVPIVLFSLAIERPGP